MSTKTGGPQSRRTIQLSLNPAVPMPVAASGKAQQKSMNNQNNANGFNNGNSQHTYNNHHQQKQHHQQQQQNKEENKNGSAAPKELTKLSKKQQEKADNEHENGVSVLNNDANEKDKKKEKVKQISEKRYERKAAKQAEKRLERERLEKEQQEEKERIEKERIERESQEKEILEKETQEKENLEKERKEQEKVEQDKVEEGNAMEQEKQETEKPADNSIEIDLTIDDPEPEPKETNEAVAAPVADAEPVKDSIETINIVDEAMDTGNEAQPQPSTPTSRARRDTRESKTPTPTKALIQENASPSSNAAQKTPSKAEKPPVPSFNEMEQTPTKDKPMEGVDLMEDEQVEQMIVEDASPIKKLESEKPQSFFSSIVKSVYNPSATSTPGKPAAVSKSALLAAAEVASSSPEPLRIPRSYSSISGRRSIRPMNKYTPSKFQTDLPMKESYYRLTTELDYSNVTNTSLNVTVGSEIPNDSSLSSFFFRGRKRDRTPSTTNLASETLAEGSPPKKARLEGFISVMSSPFTMLRSRFSKVSLKSNTTPMKLSNKLNNEEEGAEENEEVQNLSGNEEHIASEPSKEANAEKQEEEEEADKQEQKEKECAGETPNENDETKVSLGEEALDNNEIHDKASDLKDAKNIEHDTTIENSDAEDADKNIDVEENPCEVAVQPNVKKSNCLIM